MIWTPLAEVTVSHRLLWMNGFFIFSCQRGNQGSSTLSSWPFAFPLEPCAREVKEQILNIPIFCHMKILSKDFSLIYLHMSWLSSHERERVIWWLCYTWSDFLWHGGVILSLPVIEQLQSTAELTTSHSFWDTTSTPPSPPPPPTQPWSPLATPCSWSHSSSTWNKSEVAEHSHLLFQCEDS